MFSYDVEIKIDQVIATKHITKLLLINATAYNKSLIPNFMLIVI